MSNRTLGIVALVVGILIIVVVIFSHQLGLGSATFGLKKIAGIVVGAVVLVVGVVISMRKQPVIK